MAKQLKNQKHIYKIHTKRLRKNNWNLQLAFKQAKKNKEVISLADSQVLRFIDEFLGNSDREVKIESIKKEIKKLIKEEKVDKNKIKELHKTLNCLKYNEDYICLVVDSMQDFDKCNRKKGFFINDKKYIRLVGTTGGVKKQTIVYVSEGVYPELNKRLNNGRNMDKKLVPAKLEAYKALACSSSIPVTMPKGILVVNDCITKFHEDVIKIDDSKGLEPEMSIVKNYEVELIDSDGYGLILPSLSKRWAIDIQEEFDEGVSSGYCIRNSFCKGMVFTFEFDKFANEFADNFMIEDAWRKTRDIREIEMILPTSVLKLWDSYDSLEDYLTACENNGYTFSVTKSCPNELENIRTLNYQFIQSYELDDVSTRNLVQPTVDNIKSTMCMDYEQTILFLRGEKLNNKNALNVEFDYLKALMIERELLNDDFIQQKVINMRKKRIDEAKVGILDVNGNYSIISGDPFAFCQSIFGLEVTGLLKKGECYSKYWGDKNVKEIVAFRAPMTCHNNIRKIKVKVDDVKKKWYKYMKTCLILNSCDTITHAENGADKDSDAFITTDNQILLDNTKNLPAIFCVQKSAKKEIVSEKDLIKSNKAGFGDDIGAITNRITEMFDVLAKFDKESDEYKTIMYRIMCGQHYQQCAIDKIKGIKSNPMPKEWYDFKSNVIHDYDSEEVKSLKEFNQRILADKKPYFFIHIYPHLKAKYNNFLKETSDKCLLQFGIPIDELFSKENKSEEERNFIKYYHKVSPVSNNDCLMNKICRIVEDEFKDYKIQSNDANFDYRIMKSDYNYSKTMYNKIYNVYKEYMNEVIQFKIKLTKTRIEKEEKYEQMQILKETYKEKCIEICHNTSQLCNIILDICYGNNKSKQFAWDICGEQIVDNLLKRNDFLVNYIEKDENGTIKFNGNRFNLRQMYCKEECDE